MRNRASKLIVFADGNEQIGGGHISRCLTIAREAERQGLPAAFLFSDAASEALYQRLGGRAPCLILEQDSTRPAGAEEMVKKALAGGLFGPEERLCFLVDSYAAPPSLSEGLTRYGRAAYFDDLHGERPKGVIRIDYDEDLRLTPVREGFSERPLMIRAGGDRLFFPLRAGDPLGIGDAMTKAFRDKACFKKGLALHLLRGPLCGKGNPLPDSRRAGKVTSLSVGREAAEIRHPEGPEGKEFPFSAGREMTGIRHSEGPEGTGFSLSSESGNGRAGKRNACADGLVTGETDPGEGISFHPPQEDMPAFLAGFDLILTAAGNMLYEAAAMGLPAISYIFADNQLAGARAMERAGVSYFGDFREMPPEAFAAGILKQAQSLAEDKQERQRISALERSVIDGKGAERILRLLLGF